MTDFAPTWGLDALRSCHPSRCVACVPVPSIFAHSASYASDLRELPTLSARRSTRLLLVSAWRFASPSAACANSNCNCGGRGSLMSSPLLINLTTSPTGLRQCRQQSRAGCSDQTVHIMCFELKTRSHAANFVLHSNTSANTQRCSNQNAVSISALANAAASRVHTLGVC